MATAQKAMDLEPWQTDLLWDRQNGYHEEHPGGRHLFRWENTTYHLRPVKDDPDMWIVKGTGGEYRCDGAVETCSCPGYMHHKTRCKHLRALTAFNEARGATGQMDEEEMSEEQLRDLFR
jgi:hypothetical protein